MADALAACEQRIRKLCGFKAGIAGQRLEPLCGVSRRALQSEHLKPAFVLIVQKGFFKGVLFLNKPGQINGVLKGKLCARAN